MTPHERARTLGRNYRAAAVTIHDQAPMALLPRVVERTWTEYVKLYPEIAGFRHEFLRVVNGGAA